MPISDALDIKHITPENYFIFKREMILFFVYNFSLWIMDYFLLETTNMKKKYIYTNVLINMGNEKK